ncbi:MAG: NAD-glutamate dehydrogenase domain-containing protein [Sphingorhabdus sp.]
MASVKAGKAGKNSDSVPASLAKVLREALVASALPGENRGFGEAQCKEAAAFILIVAMQRKSGCANVVADSFTDEEGRLATRIAINNADMPFLVDSASALLAEHGIDVARLIHPVLAVERDGSGAITDIVPPSNTSQCLESFIYFETSRMSAKARRGIEKAMEDVMADVRSAVDDWPDLRGKLSENVGRLADKEASELLRWFEENNFTLLAHERQTRDGKRSETLGMSRVDDTTILSKPSVDLAFVHFDKKPNAPLILKANRVSTVHRNVLLDLLVVPIVENGKVAAISIIAGLWTSAALATPVTEMPVLRRALNRMLDRFGFTANGHAGKAISHALTALPHDILVTFKQKDLERITLTNMSLTDRPRPKLIAVRSPLGRHLFVFVWVPRDEISTNLRRSVQAMVADAAKAKVIGWTFSLEDGGLALIRFTLDLPDRSIKVNEAKLDDQLDKMVRGWEPGVEAALARLTDAKRAAAITQRYSPVMPTNYRTGYSAQVAALDMLQLVKMERDNRPVTRLYRRDGDGQCDLWLKVYNDGGAMALSDAVPVLENFGFDVIEERPTSLGDGELGYIHDFKLYLRSDGDADAVMKRAETIQLALSQVLDGEAENDAFNQLTVSAALNPRSVIWLRAWFRYLRQTGLSYGLLNVVHALVANPKITRAIIRYFAALHDPAFADDRGKESDKQRAAIKTGLVDVAAIDEDRVLRLFRAVVAATLRTNAYSASSGEALAFKLDSAQVPGLPQPLPWREIWVYSPRVEGIHLRAGPVARGGLRWSDRRDDFRTEVLGLMKAQRVKNAVIVPTGAKGGFYPKRLPDQREDRDAWFEEGKESYRIFIRTLLSVTDNIVKGKVVHPDDVVIRDGDDPYFVVAADKGTASFSDTANAIAHDRDFWLGDAFASGGSVGYDHKEMGITAKGAWISVQRHFAEMGINVQKDAVSVVGVGDMSGDVFGNGLLLSKSVKLIAAFDHRNIFIDPSPDPAVSWKERKRLFELPRSSWEDYNPKLISKGGGVFSRRGKSVRITKQICKLLGIEGKEVEPAELMRAILKSDAQLIWFGGIGTYIKDDAESNSEVGDHANDAIRVDASELRAKVVGEGANLGITQAGRIRFAMNGGRINADFIDNSAGVDCSDNEVNIKIPLNREMLEGRLKDGPRVKLLASMTDAVSDLVLENNRLQALALSVAESGGAGDLPAYVRLIDTFEASGKLDRKVEGIAGNDELLRRSADDSGMTRPELSVLLSTSKIILQDAIEEADFVSDVVMESELLGAFPQAIVKKHRKALLQHRLRNEIIATKLANRLINRLGMLMPFELAEEECCNLGNVAAAFAVAERLFDARQLWQSIDDADIGEATRLMLLRETAVEMRAHMADIIRNSVVGRSFNDTINVYAPYIKELAGARARLLQADVKKQIESFGRRLTGSGAPPRIAAQIVRLAELDGAIGLAALADAQQQDVKEITIAFTALGDALGLSWAQGVAMQMDPKDPWERLLVAGLARDFQALRLDFLRRRAVKNPVEGVEKWLSQNRERSDDFRAMVARAKLGTSFSAAMLAQIAGQARTLLS